MLIFIFPKAISKLLNLSSLIISKFKSIFKYFLFLSIIVNKCFCIVLLFSIILKVVEKSEEESDTCDKTTSKTTKKIKQISDKKKNEKVSKEEEDTETEEPTINNKNNNPDALKAPTEAYQSVLLDDDTGELTDDLDYSSVEEDLKSSEDEEAPLDEDPLAI